MIAKALPLLLLAALVTSEAVAQSNKIDTRHVSDDFYCVVRIDVKRLVGMATKSRAAFDKVAALMKDETKIDPRQIEALTLQFGDPDGDDEQPGFAVTMEFSEAVDREVLLSAVGNRDRFEEKVINGKTYYHHDNKTEAHVYFESDRKMTLATPVAIKSILTNGGGMGNFPSRLESAPPNSEVIIVFERTERFEISAGEFLQFVSGLPLPLKPEEWIGQVESGYALINLASEEPLRLEMRMRTEAAAEKSKAGMESLVELGKTSIGPARAMLTEAIKDLEDAGDLDRFWAMQREAMQVGLDGLDAADKLLAGSRWVQDQKNVEWRVRHMGGLTEIADLAVSGFQLLFMGVDARIGGAPAARALEPAERIERKAVPTVPKERKK